MTIRVALEHVTTYEFDRAVNLGPHLVRLRPAPHCRTPIESYSLRIEPENHFLNWQQDPFGNFVARLVFPEPAKRLQVTVDLVADMTVINPFDFFLEPEAEHAGFVYEQTLAADLAPYLRCPEPGPLQAAWLAEVDTTTEQRTIDFLVGLNRRLAGDVGYTVRMEPGVQSADDTLRLGIGSCRDSAWLLVEILRNLGLAARFVSGYLVQLVADVAPLEGPAGPKEDFTDLHAWTEVYLPGAGWVGLDPTSGLLVGEGHIPLSATPAPETAAPIVGRTDPTGVEFDFVNRVQRIHEDPRVTKPYRDDQWAAIDDLGRRIDERLEAGDVRLTQGGEPTFVSIDDQEGAEWNLVADGPAKRLLAAGLTERLHRRFGSGGVVHHGQGKWYPGEPLPRWQHTIVWRTDRVPIWTDPTLLAVPSTGPDDARSDLDAASAGRFASVLAGHLGLDAASPIPAWEDPLHALWEESLLPDGSPPPDDLDPEAPDLASEAGRRSLTARIDERAGDPTGWVLPLCRVGPSWISSPWNTRRGTLFLLPGDSPIGLRLPIRSLGWTPPPPIHEPSPLAPLLPFGTRRHPAPPPPAVETSTDEPPSAIPDLPPTALPHLPPTAVCLEVRDHHLFVFLPPLESADDALDLLAAIEATAAELDQPIVIEGYPIPADPRLSALSVTPDPGVIEVNVPPARSWPDLVSIVEGLDEDARASRLTTETFELDGTHMGTGGGSHLTLGGPTPADSPLLRRPSLLRSLITYWQHHPSLSYLFSGRFIGPSSQAPRVDEARDESLYELETAFVELDAAGDDVPPWLVDRLLRHLLVDLTGNTHRAEFCIDKLFSPDSERGRWGVVELRAFEMPPHPRMALVQALLVRAIVARCWESPYRLDPIRWGTALHDRHLLPWYVERDLSDVLVDLGRHGFDFDPAWFDPFVEFRFPRHGTVTIDGITLELRAGIEPWHVLGEESTGSGMARAVDSSVERVQLRVDGAVDGRHVITCNGVEVPLTPTDLPGVSIAGVRFKAWAPPSGLHPTIGVQSPLVFDVVDRWNERSLGGCRYHVVHEGGRAYDTFPVNAAEAESRRQSRFETIGHTPGRLVPEIIRPERHKEYPVTLDLRRARRV